MELIVGAVAIMLLLKSGYTALHNASIDRAAAKAGMWDFLNDERARRHDRAISRADRRAAYANAWAERRRIRRQEATGGDGADYRPGLAAYFGDLYHGFWEKKLAARQTQTDQPDEQPAEPKTLTERAEEKVNDWRGRRHLRVVDQPTPEFDFPDKPDDDPVIEDIDVIHDGHGSTQQVPRVVTDTDRAGTGFGWINPEHVPQDGPLRELYDELYTNPNRERHPDPVDMPAENWQYIDRYWSVLHRIGAWDDYRARQDALTFQQRSDEMRRYAQMSPDALAAELQGEIDKIRAQQQGSTTPAADAAPTQGGTMSQPTTPTVDVAEVQANEDLRRVLTSTGAAAQAFAEAMEAAEGALKVVRENAKAASDAVEAKKFDACATAAIHAMADGVHTETLSRYHELGDALQGAVAEGLASLEQYRDAEDVVAQTGIDATTLAATSS